MQSRLLELAPSCRSRGPRFWRPLTFAVVGFVSEQLLSFAKRVCGEESVRRLFVSTPFKWLLRDASYSRYPSQISQSDCSPPGTPFIGNWNWNGSDQRDPELAKIAEVVTIGQDRDIQEGFRTQKLPSKSAQTAWISPRG